MALLRLSFFVLLSCLVFAAAHDQCTNFRFGECDIAPVRHNFISSLNMLQFCHSKKMFELESDKPLLAQACSPFFESPMLASCSAGGLVTGYSSRDMWIETYSPLTCRLRFLRTTPRSRSPRARTSRRVPGSARRRARTQSTATSSSMTPSLETATSTLSSTWRRVTSMPETSRLTTSIASHSPHPPSARTMLWSV